MSDLLTTLEDAISELSRRPLSHPERLKIYAAMREAVAELREQSDPKSSMNEQKGTPEG